MVCLVCCRSSVDEDGCAMIIYGKCRVVNEVVFVVMQAELSGWS